MIQENLTHAVIPHGIYWAIEPQAARQYWNFLLNIDARAHREQYEAEQKAKRDAQVAARGDDAPSKPFVFKDGIAWLNVTGPIIKGDSSWGNTTSSARLKRQVRQVKNDPDVKGVMNIVDSPGGSVAGTSDASAAMAELARAKPVYSFFEDQACSAALWIGSNATKIFANSMAVVGSIGTYMQVLDTSGAYEKLGYKMHLVKSPGFMKGAGADGIPISDDQLDDFERVLLDMNGHFIAAMMQARNLTPPKVQALATGQVWLGKEAMDKGLVDAIGSIDEAYAELRTVSNADRGSPASQVFDMGRGAAAAASAETSTFTTVEWALFASGSQEVLAKVNAALSNPHIDPAYAKQLREHIQTISAAGGRTGQPGAGTTQAETPKGENPRMKNILVRALTRFGLAKMATAIVASNSEEPEEMAALMATKVDEEVLDRIANDPLTMACAANGIKTAADLQNVMAAKALGDKYVADLRDVAKKEAIRAYGETAGPKIGAQVDNLGHVVIAELRDSWRAQADEKFKTTTEKAASRETRPANFKPEDGADPDGAPPKTAWEQLNATEQAHIERTGAKTAEDKEKNAKALLDLRAGKMEAV